ncbi:parathyroid hormone/parathyroid hormone-related peptide receptor-like isoform X2 [Lycorma delicatula]|uniref:parathyroid hormone/parathyroid hormone-related peptide receptor-like isoform X2 n=1 Tax=Lycorma delicatula TaxID=130591 RepID=UPI003F510536
MDEATEDDELTKIQFLEARCRLNETRFEGGNQWCPPAWDGLLCWPATPAGNLISLSCPEYFQGFNPLNKATRRCMEDGTWYFNYERNSTWTNYSECFTEKISPHHQILFKYVPIIKAVSQVGYSVSLITLIVAFCIFATFKGLRCPRNKLHMHLFLSFMLRAFSTLFKDLETSRLARQTSTRDGVQVKFRNDWESCRAVTSLWQYFLLANYSWILMEGLYLHNLIFLALFSDTSSIALYVVLGWGLPLIFIVPWIIARIIWENTLCWSINDNPYISLLIKGPTTLSVLLNFVLFIKIVRVLLMKLQASVNEQNRRFRRWAKSTLVLVPLFGVHYALFIGMPYVECGPEVEAAWLFGDQLFASFQGFFVALLYCFMNGEVRAELNKKCRRWWARRHGSPPAFRRPSNPMHSVTSTSYIRGGKFNHKGYRDKRKNGLGKLEMCMIHKY